MNQITVTADNGDLLASEINEAFAAGPTKITQQFVKVGQTATVEAVR